MHKPKRLKKVCAVLSLAVALHNQAAGQTIADDPIDGESAYLRQRAENTISIARLDALGLIQAVELQVIDHVQGGCWTNVADVKARLRAELERSQIPVFDEPLAFPSPFMPTIQLRVFGGLPLKDDLCVATPRLSLSFQSSPDFGGLTTTGEIFEIPGDHVYWARSTTLVRSTNVDDLMMATLQRWIDTFVSEVSKGRRAAEVRRVFEAWPEVELKTRDEWEKEIQETLERMEKEAR